VAGDEAFVRLRKRRPRHRTLTRVEERLADHEKKQVKQSQQAEDEAKREKEAAQKRLDNKVKELQERKDIDDKTKQIMLRTLQETENRILEAAKANIDNKKNAAVARSRRQVEQAINRIWSGIRIKAVALPLIPPVLIGFIIFFWRLFQERSAGRS
jgi:ABC-2 type transport system permease protein